MNEMIALPIVWALIVGTALLSAIVSASLPMLPMWWNAFIRNIKRVFTYKPKQNVYCDDLSKRIDDLEEQIHNLAEKQATKDRNRKSNIRRDVREYLEELRNN
jgi:uncharacterized membrane protein YfbV (UPF0208 family)